MQRQKTSLCNKSCIFNATCSVGGVALGIIFILIGIIKTVGKRTSEVFAEVQIKTEYRPDIHGFQSFTLSR